MYRLALISLLISISFSGLYASFPVIESIATVDSYSSLDPEELSKLDKILWFAKGLLGLTLYGIGGLLIGSIYQANSKKKGVFKWALRGAVTGILLILVLVIIALVEVIDGDLLPFD